MPFSFTVFGTPVSQQARRRAVLRAWKRKVKQAAYQKWPPGNPPTSTRLKIVITYYYLGGSPDTDNIIKPIMDALKGLVYTDDNQICDVVAAKRDLDGSFRVRGMSPVLSDGFCYGSDFVYVKIDEAPNPEELL